MTPTIPRNLRLRTIAASAIVASTFLACSYSWDFDANDGGADASTDATIKDGGNRADGTGSAIGDASSDADAGDANPSTAIPCDASTQCDPSARCAFSDLACGAGVSGACVPRQVCSGVIASGAGNTKFCGCNGTIYSSQCAAIEAGVDTSTNACGDLSGYVTCGDRYCDPGTAYCAITKTGAVCDSWGACSPHGCGCADAGCPSTKCSSSDGGVTRTCD